MVYVAGGQPSPEIAIAVPSYWGHSTLSGAARHAAGQPDPGAQRHAGRG